jgi:hypothetical protein
VKIDFLRVCQPWHCNIGINSEGGIVSHQPRARDHRCAAPGLSGLGIISWKLKLVGDCFCGWWVVGVGVYFFTRIESIEHWLPFLIFTGLISLDFKIFRENGAGFTTICQSNRKIGFAAMSLFPRKMVLPE